jgi:2-polyprenyl-3-methyl-5-hydroxy-6-metoxy-1,4-benzoquinol methylase
MSDALSCAICSAETRPSFFPVHPNFRKFRDQEFHVWRCDGCDSLHTLETVDLDEYYRAAYDFDGAGLNWMVRKLLRGHIIRLERSGLEKEHSILDFGCGSGRFLELLREHGYQNVHGYDAHSPKFRDPSLLERRYDVVFSQDVVEHAVDPWEMLRTMDRLVAPGGLVVIGTPDASGIDPAEAERHVHALHVPFHRHIFSERALSDAGRKLGWTPMRLDRGIHDTWYPAVNHRYRLFYMASWDNTLDSLKPLRTNLRLLIHPLAHFYALFGALVPLKSECQIHFRASAKG